MDFWPKNGQIWPKLAFSAKYQHFGPFDLMPDQKNAGKLPRWFSHYVGTKTLTYSRNN